MAVATILHRFGKIETAPFLAVMGLVAVTAALGLCLAATGLAGLWRHGYAGGRRSAVGLALCLFIPRIADISTDLADPPQFARDTASGLMPDLQASAYPEVTGRRYPISVDGVLALVERQVAESGWQVTGRRGSLGGSGEVLLDAEAATPIMGFRDSVVIRITDEGDTAYVDMRSKSGFGDYDMGANAARIMKFMKALDALAALAPAAQTAK
jgi:hypothetical protein